MDYAVRLQALCRQHNPLKLNKTFPLRNIYCNHRKFNIKNFSTIRSSYFNKSNIRLSINGKRYFSSTSVLRKDLDDIDDIDDIENLEADDEFYPDDYEGYEDYGHESREERFKKMVFGKQFIPEDTDILEDMEDEDVDELIRIQRGEEVEKRRRAKEEEEEESRFEEGKEIEDKDIDSEEAVLDAMRDEIMVEMAHASDPVFSERSRRKAYELHAMNPS